ncbi:T9SS type A sorting domain-containing protein [Flavobacterium sp. Sd200]|uniref:T9SS type A sorting domain-containing protein n=1 Tax=Flavobacterium sp. Sd200 TaxID=2692211 RepID=UPI001371B109|nr:T9SS type A sorting domain-containing protein [Flavobacterium sp. Sd200]MXN91130.1 T9SS type A sorting domain-containing protein [Flavobacterium sp. Sd200]
MNHKNLCACAVAFLCLTVAYSQDILWERSYGGKQAEYLLDAQPTADYGFILAGSSLSGKNGNKTDDNAGDLDYWIWKMDEKGDFEWQKSLGGSGPDLLYSIRNTRDGGFILAGTSESPADLQKKDSCRGREDFWIVKLNAKGGEEWQKTLGGGGQDIVKSIAPTADGGYIIGGTSSSPISHILLKNGNDPYGKKENSRGGLDFWIVKLDDKGTVKWQRTLGGKYSDVLESIEPTSDGGYIVGGYSNSPASQDKSEQGYGAGDYWILKLDKDGATEWQRVFGGEEDDHLYVVSELKGGGYIVGGNSASSTTGNKNKANKKGTDYWILRLDEKGEVLWQETYNTGKVDLLTSLVENSDGTFLIGGYAQTEVMGTTKKDKKDINDYVAIKIAHDGEELWRRTIGSNGEDKLKKLIETRDGGYLLAGTSKGDISRDKNSGKGSNDFWVVKLLDKEKEKPERRKTQLEAIPNPAGQFTNIIVGFEFNSGTASLFDLSGRQLQSFPVTTRTIPLEMGSYPEGVYIVEVKTDKGTDSVKVMKGAK